MSEMTPSYRAHLRMIRRRSAGQAEPSADMLALIAVIDEYMAEVLPLLVPSTSPEDDAATEDAPAPLALVG